MQVVKSGDWVDYSTGLAMPVLLDAALAARRDELYDVKLRGNLLFGPIQVVECDPQRQHFVYNSWHCSAYERQLCDRGLCNYIPMIFRSVVSYYRHFLRVKCGHDVRAAQWIGMGTSIFPQLWAWRAVFLETADVVILEVNERLPRIYGGL